VRAREDVAFTSYVVISRERPELEERAPNTTNLRALGVRLLNAVDSRVEWPVATEVLIVVGKVVVESEVTIGCGVALITSSTLREEVNRVANSSLATVSPVVVLINAKVAIASTIIRSAEDAVELTEVVTHSVTSSLELNLAEGVVNPTASSRLVVVNAVIGMSSNSGIKLTESISRDIAAEVIARAATTSAVKVRVVEHLTTFVVIDVVIIGNSGPVTTEITPVPVSTAELVRSGLKYATRTALKSKTVTAIAIAVEDVAEVV